MKRINEYIKNNLLGVMVILGLFCIQLLSIIFVISDKYDDTLMELNKKIEVLENERDTATNNYNDCLLEHPNDQYFIVPTEDGFVIDGQLYEKVEGYEAFE